MAKKKKKYQVGTGRAGIVRNYIKTPEQTIAENDIAFAKAQAKAASNPWTMALDAVGGMAVNYGTSMMGGSGGAAKGAIGAGVSAGSMANGGVVGSEEVEIEGEEVIEDPNGNVAQAKGPSHENGGIDVELPRGTKVFSKRIKKFNESMATRKLKREKRLNRINKKLEQSPSDKALKNTLKRIQITNEQEEQADLQVQEMISAMESDIKLAYGTGSNGIQRTKRKMFFGGDVGDDVGEEEGGGFSNFMGSLFGGGEGGNDGGAGFGDYVSMAGTAFSAFAPMLNTKKNRAGDTPNINAFKDFGQDAIETNRGKEQFANQIKDNKLQRNIEQAHANKTRSRNTARGVNTMRALDFAADQTVNKAANDIFSAYSQDMMAMLDTEAQLENVRDAKVMQGEDVRDTRDRQDRDNYYTQLAQDTATKGQGIQELGKDFSQIANRKEQKALVNAGSKNFKWDSTKGLTDKKGNVVMSKKDIKTKAKQAGMTPEEWAAAYADYLDSEDNTENNFRSGKGTRPATNFE